MRRHSDEKVLGVRNSRAIPYVEMRGKAPRRELDLLRTRHRLGRLLVFDCGTIG